MSLEEFRKEFDAALLRFLWRQWAQLGVSASIVGRDSWAQDPEPLLLATFELARADARLFDEAADWLALNAGRLSLQRVKNLLAADADTSRGLVAAVLAALAREDPGFRWRLDVRVPGPDRQEVLFDGTTAASASTPDPAFLAAGFVRGRLRRSGKSRTPASTLPVAFAFRLRELFGVTARADALRVLLLHPRGELTSADVALACAFAKRNVFEALESVASAGLVRQRRRGRASLWSLDRPRWCAFLGVNESELPAWVDWPALLGGLQRLARWLRAASWTEAPALVQASRAREALAAAAPSLAAGAPHWRPPDGRAHQGVAFLVAFEESVREVLRILEGADRPGAGKTRRPSQ
jgi:hypothetical protein